MFKKKPHKMQRKGFALIEIILAVALFSMASTAVVSTVMYGQESTVNAGSKARATFLAEEGLEAVRSMRDEDINNMTDGSYGLAIADNKWEFSDFEEVIDVYTRTVDILSVDEDTRKITSTVSWLKGEDNLQSVALSTYLTSWQKEVICGDTVCESDENLVNCIGDCTVCGDGICDSLEDLEACVEDCTVCGDGVCDSLETEETCVDDCVAGGDDGDDGDDVVMTW